MKMLVDGISDHSLIAKRVAFFASDHSLIAKRVAFFFFFFIMVEGRKTTTSL